MDRAGAEVFLTGATGFVGGHVLDALLRRGYRVRALVRGRGRLAERPGLTVVRGDLGDPGSLVASLRGCTALVHTAAVYSFAPPDGDVIRRVNLAGTTGILVAARLAGVGRAVVTSSSAAVGPARDTPADERSWAEPHGGESAYHRSKVDSERAALAARVPVVTILPTAPVGPGDHRPTPTGRIVIDVMRGAMPGFLSGGMNVVDVRDVAWLHVAAMERGRAGQRYVAGGADLSLAEFWRRIADAAGRRPPRLRIPLAVALVAGVIDEARSRLSGAEPRVPVEGVRMGVRRMFASSAKAEAELGYRSSPVEPAIRDAVDWYRERGYAA
ncbi:MAG: NAD-dependent epimerase/dehydratase family protein [Candidatus Dormibacteraeota bacterium]|nr:NAD-dependent epimerase/dehydratase family protein [Candidatus Dormibacteraeota bacterium]